MDWDRLFYQTAMFDRHAEYALCLDIEVCYRGGPISVIGLYRAAEGPIERNQLLRGHNLTTGNLAHALRWCRLLLVYNGRRFDIPKIQKEFPGAIAPGTEVVDLFEFAEARYRRKISLKELEGYLGVPRPDFTNVRGKATKWWKRYAQFGDIGALDRLLEYNNQDAVNLWFVARSLLGWVREMPEYDRYVERYGLGWRPEVRPIGDVYKELRPSFC